MLRYRVVNLGQASLERISVGDFNAFHKAALSAVDDVAAIARAHGLSSEEESAVQSALRKVQGYTVAMTPCPIEPLVSSEFPWWAAGLAGLAIGGAIIHFGT